MPRPTPTIALAGLTGAITAAVVRRKRRRHTTTDDVGQECRSAARRVRTWTHRVAYLLRGGHPDPDVSDPVLVDRVRSSIGPLIKRLDLPHIHVMVINRVALLHGDVSTYGDVTTLERAVRNVSGIDGVESFLHVGLIPSDTRPSAGRASAQPPSDALATLLRSAGRGPSGGVAPAALVRSVLTTLLDVVPEDERRHVLSHLPEDVRRLTGPSPRPDLFTQRVRTSADFLAAIVSADPDLDPADAEAATVGVLATFHQLIPEEVDDLDACLPHEIRTLWRRAGIVARDRSTTAHTFLHLLEQT